MYRKSLIIGVIITSVVMTLNLKVPILLLFIIFSIILTLSNLYKVKRIPSSLIIVFCLLISQLSLTHKNLTKEYIPTNRSSNSIGEIVVLKDSKKVGFRFITTAKVKKINKDNLEVESGFILQCYSSKKLNQGDSYLGVVIKNNRLLVTEESVYRGNHFKVRRDIVAKIREMVCSGLLLGLLIGDKTQMEGHIVELFRKTGTSHILALSGFHLGLITLIVLTVLKPFISGKLRYWLAIFILLLYLLITGISPSLLRAFLLILIITLCKAKYIDASIVDIIMISFLIIVLFKPSDFYSISFKLSYSAILGVIIIGNKLSKLWLFKKIPMFISVSLSASLGAILLTSPFVLSTFGELYPVGIIASLVLTPIIVIYIWVGIASIFVTPLQKIILFLDKAIISLASFLSKSPYIVINDKNSLFVSFIFISLPVILYFTMLLRRRDVRRFNSKFKL